MCARMAVSAFGDEISDDLSEQLDTLVRLGIGFLELRGVWGKNVLDLTDEEVRTIASACEQSSVSVSAIGSPIGKSPIEAPSQQELDNLARAVEIALSLNVKMVRVFSFYPPDGTTPKAYDEYIDESARRLSELAERAAVADITLLLENEKDIVGDTIARCRALLTTVNSPALQFAWDPANFVQVGEGAPTDDGWSQLGSYVAHVHVKDALADGDVRPAGEGDGQVGKLLDRLRDRNYEGILALEPHLAIAGHSSGFSGVDGMTHAADALRRLMQEHGIEEAGKPFSE
jgi:sugar phosphate isomerase/epimerase